MKRLLVLLTALAWLWAAPALCAPAIVGEASSAGAGTTTAVTTTQDCPVGAILFITGGGTDSNNAVPNAAADNLGTHNTYTFPYGGDGQGPISNSSGYSKITTDLASGTVVTVTFNVSSTTRGAVLVCSSDFTWTASPSDIATFGSHASSSAPSKTTATLAQAAEQAIGYVQQSVTSQTVTEDAGHGWTTIGSYSLGGANTLWLAYKNTAATTALVYAPTLGGTTNWIDNILTFKESGAVAKACTLSLLGVGPC